MSETSLHLKVEMLSEVNGRLRAENAKLRKFANTMRVTIKDACGVCDEVYCSSYDEEQECCMFDSVARSLGIEVE